MKKFDEFNLDKEILKSLNILNYNTPTEVQDKVIPKLIDKNNNFNEYDKYALKLLEN